VQIIIDIHLGQDGRPAGTIRAADQGELHVFSGNLEFLAVIERLYQPEQQRTEGFGPQEES
jgi:hypothetical protein